MNINVLLKNESLEWSKGQVGGGKAVISPTCFKKTFNPFLRLPLFLYTKIISILSHINITADTIGEKEGKNEFCT